MEFSIKDENPVMDKKPLKKSTGEKDTQNNPVKKKKGKTTKRLKDIHMKDKNHVITDEEIKELEFDLTSPDRSTSHTPDIPNDSDRPKDEDKDPKIVTPWDVIE